MFTPFVMRLYNGNKRMTTGINGHRAVKLTNLLMVFIQQKGLMKEKKTELGQTTAKCTQTASSISFKIARKDLT